MNDVRISMDYAPMVAKAKLNPALSPLPDRVTRALFYGAAAVFTWAQEKRDEKTSSTALEHLITLVTGIMDLVLEEYSYDTEEKRREVYGVIDAVFAEMVEATIKQLNTISPTES